MYWSDGAEVGFTLDQYKKQQDVVQAIRTIEFQGGKTNTAQALRLLRTQVFQVNIGGGQLGPINHVIVKLRILLFLWGGAGSVL